MKFLPKVLPLVLLVALQKNASALFADEAGQNDFTITTAGHGIIGTTYAQLTSDSKSVLTSSSSPFATAIVGDYGTNPVGTGSSSGSNGGCYLSSRSVTDGSLNWRRNVCSQPMPIKNDISGSVVRHAIYSNPHDARVYTLDDYGMLRIWNDTNGALLKEMLLATTGTVSVEGGHNPRIVNLDTRVMGAILTVVAEGEETITEIVAFYNDAQFQDDAMLSARDILSKAQVTPKTEENSKPSIFGVLSKPSSSSSYYVLAGWDRDGVTSFSEIGMMEVKLVDNEVVLSKEFMKLDQIGPSASIDIKVSSVHVERHNEEDSIVATVVGKDAELIYNPTSKKVEEESSKIQVQCDDFLVDASGKDGLIQISGGKNIDVGDTIKGLFGLQCHQDFFTVLVSTSGGATRLLKVSRKDSQVDTVWETEEAFASASSAIFLDNGTSLQQVEETNNDDEEDDEAALIESLSFSSRISSQINSLVSFLSGGFIESISSLVSGSGSGVSQKDAVFGLNKVAIILSNHFSKVLAIDTSSSPKGKGSLIWKLNLNPSAKWHKVVHGAANSRSSAFGQGMHHPHSPEILILSQTNDSVEWRCVDGLKGRIISESTIPTTSTVSQIIPVHGHSHASGGCKQNAALIFQDNSIAFAPTSAKAIIETSISTDVGMYTHTIDKDTGVFRSMKLSADSSKAGLSGKVETVGETVFDPNVEKIINIAYPQRNEVVQSPATILGDDSLLLKYLNPHLCVVVTEATTKYIEDFEDTNEKSAFRKALGSKQKTNVKKPLGATKPGEATPKATNIATPVPTLFVNVIDTISGQVLHRVSHSHAQGAGSTSPAIVPVTISENWIVYAFSNAKSRRTEVGVLTLHEGMIDKHGITAFSSPEQLLTFSSLKSPKPIVLSKTYGVNYPVTAIGVTNTKGGISSKNFIFATGIDGKVVRVDRRLLDPRRPSGEPKKTEKKEGLMQYAPLIPLAPVTVQSYSNHVEDASFIISTSANLESQTLILALGGPDIFFSRFAPSKGFDSLPESFNKLLIVMVLIALYMVLRTTKRMGQNRNLKLFWS